MCSIIDFCFMCSKDNKCNVVDNKIVTQVEYLMPEITIIKLWLPLRICSICEKNLQLFNTFKQDCVENSIRLEARIKETQDTNVIENCTTYKTNINKIDDCVKEELFDKSDNLEVKYSSIDENCIKKEPLQENPYDCEFGTILQENPSHTDTHLHETNSVDMKNESDQNSNDPDDVASINNEINIEENILVTNSPSRKTYTIKEAQYNTNIQEKCTTSERYINKIHEVYIKEEAREEILDESDTPTAKDYFVEDIYTKETPLQENLHGREVCDKLQDTLKEDRLPQTDTHVHKGSSINMGGESDQNSDDNGNVVSVNNEINTEENILVTDSSDRKMYTCLICKKGFKDLSYLKIRHMNIHIGKKDFQCNECKKWFSDKSHLNRHIKQHNGVKDFQCNECKKWFTRKSSLATHMKQHTGVKDFQCIECKKWFAQKANLASHMKQHTGVKDFQCNECKKWFLNKSNFNRHMKQHTGIKDFQCTICNKMFYHKTNLNRHMKIHT